MAVKPPVLNLETVGRVVLQAQGNVRFPTRDEVKALVGNPRPNRVVAVCAMPKSGSTFLSNALATSLRRDYMAICYAYSSNEHDVYLPALIGGVRLGIVSQLHMKATPHNVSLLNIFRIRPIVLTRNLFDALESLARDLRSKDKYEGYGTGGVGYSFVWLDHNIAGLSDERLYDFVIHMALPWYLGRERFSVEQISRVERAFSYYPDVDFSPLGLAPREAADPP